MIVSLGRKWSIFNIGLDELNRMKQQILEPPADLVAGLFIRINAGYTFKKLSQHDCILTAAHTNFENSEVPSAYAFLQPIPQQIHSQKNLRDPLVLGVIKPGFMRFHLPPSSPRSVPVGPTAWLQFRN
jgi:hypothetical protein